jgi:Rrf2 family protein
MLDLAVEAQEGPTSVKDISKRQDISAPYLEQILGQLKVAGLVKSRIGLKGGFSLSVPPSGIKLSTIIETMEGSIAHVNCADDPTVCSRADRCLARNVWVEMKRAMVQILESTSLQDLVDGKYEPT